MNYKSLTVFNKLGKKSEMLKILGFILQKVEAYINEMLPNKTFLILTHMNAPV